MPLPVKVLKHYLSFHNTTDLPLILLDEVVSLPHKDLVSAGPKFSERVSWLPGLSLRVSWLPGLSLKVSLIYFFQSSANHNHQRNRWICWFCCMSSRTPDWLLRFWPQSEPSGSVTSVWRHSSASSWARCSRAHLQGEQIYEWGGSADVHHHYWCNRDFLWSVSCHLKHCLRLSVSLIDWFHPSIIEVNS